MDATYIWNKDFRERIIALCLTPGWFASHGIDLIKPEYFDTSEEQLVVDKLIEFQQEYKRVPGRDEAYALVAGDDKTDTLLDNVYDCLATGELEFARDLAVQFAKEQAMKLAILESVDDIEAGRLAEPLERVKKAMTVGIGAGDLGLDLKGNLDWVYNEAWEDKVPTGIYLADIMLGGGLGRGELGIFLAATNVGKTRMLVNVGASAAGLMGRCNVGHVTLELAAAKVAKRYGARTIFRWIKKEDDPDLYAVEFQHRTEMMLPGNIRIKEFPTQEASVDDIEAWMERLSLMGQRLDLLIVDYPGIMRHTLKGDGWEQLAHTYNQLRSIAMRWNIPVWGAAQGNRSSLGKALVTLKDIADSFKATGNADVILAVCQTLVEEEADMIRLFAAKVRDGTAGWMVRCFLDQDSHAVIGDEIVTVSQVMDEIKRSENDDDGLSEEGNFRKRKTGG